MCLCPCGAVFPHRRRGIRSLDACTITGGDDGDDGRILDPPGARRSARHDPPARAGQDRAAGRRDRSHRGVPAGHPQAARRARRPRAPVRGAVRRHRDGNADAADGGRGDRQGLRLVGAHPHGAGARHAADPALRHRRAEGALPAPLRERRVVARVRAVRARGGLGSGGAAHERRSRRRRVGHQRAEELDHERRRGGLLHRLREDRPRAAIAARRSSSRPTARASSPASSSTSSASRARRPARRRSPTCACRRRT